MPRVIILDSSPLGLIVQRLDNKRADECRQWLAQHVEGGADVLVSDVIDYEVRRELLRLRLAQAIDRLDAFYTNPFVRRLPVTDASLRLAADLWARARQEGTPTADPQALDIDVVLAAQTLLCGVPADELVVATSNVVHLSLFVPAQDWWSI